jgi:hypothetical protein
MIARQARVSVVVMRRWEPHDPGRSCLLHANPYYVTNRTTSQERQSPAGIPHPVSTWRNAGCQPVSIDWFFPDTEEVTGSNPVASTTVIAGQRAISAERTALLTCRGRAAAATYSPAEPDGPSGAGRHGTNTAQGPRRVVATPGQPVGRASRRQLAQDAPAGTCEHLLLLVILSQPTAPWR